MNKKFNPVDSNFSEIILLLLKERLNLLTCEIWQMCMKDNNFHVNEYSEFQLTKEVILKIANNDIVSAHLTQKKAKQAMRIYNYIENGIEIECTCDEGYGWNLPGK